MNMIGQNTPWGSLEYQQTGTSWMMDPAGNMVPVPQHTANVTLSPQQQAIFDQSQAAQTNLATLANEKSDWLRSYLDQPFEFNNRDAETWAWDLASPRILENQRQNEEALRTRLINQGLRPGSAAWNAEMTRMTNANSDQMNQLALTGREQAFNEAMALRTLPLNEIIGLMSGSQVNPPNSSFAQTPQSGVAGVNYTGLVNQQYQSQLDSHQGMMGGLFGLGTALIGLSDVRAKQEIRLIGHLPSGLGIYSYRYKGLPGRHVGVMAQEVAERIPDAVSEGDGGYLYVDYGRIH